MSEDLIVIPKGKAVTIPYKLDEKDPSIQQKACAFLSEKGPQELRKIYLRYSKGKGGAVKFWTAMYYYDTVKKDGTRTRQLLFIPKDKLHYFYSDIKEEILSCNEPETPLDSNGIPMFDERYRKELRVLRDQEEVKEMERVETEMAKRQIQTKNQEPSSPLPKKGTDGVKPPMVPIKTEKPKKMTAPPENEKRTPKKKEDDTPTHKTGNSASHVHEEHKNQFLDHLKAKEPSQEYGDEYDLSNIVRKISPAVKVTPEVIRQIEKSKINIMDQLSKPEQTNETPSLLPTPTKVEEPQTPSSSPVIPVNKGEKVNKDSPSMPKKKVKTPVENGNSTNEPTSNGNGHDELYLPETKNSLWQFLHKFRVSLREDPVNLGDPETEGILGLTYEEIVKKINEMKDNDDPKSNAFFFFMSEVFQKVNNTKEDLISFNESEGAYSPGLLDTAEVTDPKSNQVIENFFLTQADTKYFDPLQNKFVLTKVITKTAIARKRKKPDGKKKKGKREETNEEESNVNSFVTKTYRISFSPENKLFKEVIWPIVQERRKGNRFGKMKPNSFNEEAFQTMFGDDNIGVQLFLNVFQELFPYSRLEKKEDKEQEQK